jgi:hypothetical protein
VPIDDRVDPIGDARIDYRLHPVYFIRGIVLVIPGQDGDPNHGAFPVLRQVVDGAGIEELLSLARPAVQRHSMQGSRVAVLVDNLVPLNAQLAVNAGECLLAEARRNQGQTGKGNQDDPRNTTRLTTVRIDKSDSRHAVGLHSCFPATNDCKSNDIRPERRRERQSGQFRRTNCLSGGCCEGPGQ